VDPGRQEVGARAGVEVVVEHVRKGFEDGRIAALEDVSLHLRPAEFVSLIGPSGCGKSTLLNLIGALDTPDAGSIRVGGQRIETLGDRAGYRAQTVGFVFQFHNLIPTLNALENVQVPMLGRDGSRREREQRAADLLGEVGLSHRLRAYPGTLSGGERQRVAIARALANSPQLLLADEPTGSLDSANGIAIMNLLGRLREQRRMTILLVTNDLAIAGIADRTLRMRDGRLEDAAARPLEPATPGEEPRSA
jgi:ABC-type lipoprotein export system ATPase subunit